jgi:hypothetical protein
MSQLESLLLLARPRVEDLVQRYPALLDMSSETIEQHIHALCGTLGLDPGNNEDMARLSEVGGRLLQRRRVCVAGGAKAGEG